MLDEGCTNPTASHTYVTGFYYVRVYNSDKADRTEQGDIKLAKKMLSFMLKTDTEKPERDMPWIWHPPHDDFDDHEWKKQSAFAVLARLWQVCKNEGLRAFLDENTVQTVWEHLQVVKVDGRV